MAGQSLMCVWQAVAALDTSVSGGAPANLIKTITKDFAKTPKFRYSESVFDNMFRSGNVDFETYRNFVSSELLITTTPLRVAEADIEQQCWDRCRQTYKFGSRSNVTTDDLFMLWQMFNRITNPGTCPPVISVVDMNWFVNKIAVPMSRKWNDLPLSTKPMTFVDTIKILNEQVFSRDSLSDAQRSIEQLHNWLVKEVSQTGWMFKRTRKQGNNWTTWQRRYFILTPGDLRYFSSARTADRDLKGKISITSQSRLESLDDYKYLTRRYGNRFRVSNIPSLEMELSPVTDHEKNAWMAAVNEVIDACKNGTTPVQAVLNERVKKNSSTKEPMETIDQAMSRMKSQRLSKIPDKLLPQEEEDIIKPPSGRQVAREREMEREVVKSQAPEIVNSKQPEMVSTQQPSVGWDGDEGEVEDEEEFDNNSYSFEKLKVKKLFDQIDTNGNGLLNEREFDEFLRVLVGQSSSIASSAMSKAIFADIDEDGDANISVDEFYAYFTKLVLDQSPASEAESLLREEFLKADRDGDAALSFGDFSEFVWERRRSFRYQGLMSAFDNMESTVQSDGQFSQLREFVIGQCGPVEDGQMNTEMSSFRQSGGLSSELGRQIRDIQDDTETNNAASSLSRQWSEFVKEKDMSATDPRRIAAKYNLIDVACFTKDKGREPKKLSVDAVRWEEYPDPNTPADLIFPADSQIEVPTVEASDDNLKYFGCRLADEHQEQIATLYHHTIEDMGYANQPLNAGPAPGGIGSVGLPGMEKSTKCRFICPLGSDNGLLILARWEGDEESIEITGFKVAQDKSVYIPAGTMYSTDHLTGSWRMLGDDAELSFAFLRRQFTPDNDRDLENISFKLVA